MAKTARELREQKAQLRALLADGKTEYECLEELGFTRLSDLRRLRSQLLSDELEEVNDESAELLFIRYKMRMDACVADLDAVIKKGKEKHSSLNAVVGAVKAKRDILDKVIERGQALGVLPTVQAEESERGKDVEKLREKVEEKHEKLRELVRGYGLEGYEDSPDEEIYFAPENFEEPETEKVS